MKRLIVCCDGTWQDAGCTFPTNVAKIASAIKPIASDGTLQCIYYGAGVGTSGVCDKILGGGIGKGIDLHIKDAYRFLCLNYVPDDEIYLFGFSRGSYTVRSLAGLIYNSGILRPEHLDKIDTKGSYIGAYQLYRNRQVLYKPGSPIAREFRENYCVAVPCCNGDDRGRVPITLLACWDTVGSLGLPPIGMFNLKKFFPPWLLKLFPGKYRFHDTHLSRIILNAVHAVAIDERRKVFNATPMHRDPAKMDANGDVATVTGAAQKLAQTWFPGVHGCIGGGTEKLQGLSDVPLVWLLDKIDEFNLGLEFDRTRMTHAPQPAPFDYTTPFNKISLLMIPGIIWRAMENTADFERDVHETAKRRWRDVKSYRPKTLSRRFAEQLNQWDG